MKPSQVLREAARRVEIGESAGGCAAINQVTGGYCDEFWTALHVYEGYFYQRTQSGYWWPPRNRYGPRIIGLCLAAAIAESEGQ